MSKTHLTLETILTQAESLAKKLHKLQNDCHKFSARKTPLCATESEQIKKLLFLSGAMADSVSTLKEFLEATPATGPEQTVPDPANTAIAANEPKKEASAVSEEKPGGVVAEKEDDASTTDVLFDVTITPASKEVPTPVTVEPQVKTDDFETIFEVKTVKETTGEPREKFAPPAIDSADESADFEVTVPAKQIPDPVAAPAKQAFATQEPSPNDTTDAVAAFEVTLQPKAKKTPDDTVKESIDIFEINLEHRMEKHTGPSAEPDTDTIANRAPAGEKTDKKSASKKNEKNNRKSVSDTPDDGEELFLFDL